jgi:hypothetical protein
MLRFLQCCKNKLEVLLENIRIEWLWLSMENALAYSIEVHIQRSIYRGSGLPYCIINYDNKKMWCGTDPWYTNVFIYNCEKCFECKKFCNSDS